MDTPGPPSPPPASRPQGPLLPQQPPFSFFHPSPSSFSQRFTPKTWLLIIGLIVALLAIVLGIALVRQRQAVKPKAGDYCQDGCVAYCRELREGAMVAVGVCTADCAAGTILDLECGCSCCCRCIPVCAGECRGKARGCGGYEKETENGRIWPENGCQNENAVCCVRDWDAYCGNNKIEESQEECDGTAEPACPEGMTCQECVCSSDEPTPPPTALPTEAPTPPPTEAPPPPPPPGEGAPPTALPTEPPVSTPTITPTPTPTVTPTLTPSPTPVPGCGDSCTYDSDCDGDLVCREVEETIKCVNKDCPFDDNCVCPAEPTPSPGRGAPEPTPSPTLTSLPGTPLPKAEKPKELPPTASVQRTILGLVGGVLLLLIGLAL